MAFKFNPTTGKFDIVSDPGGSDTQVQFNDGGSFGGDSDLTYNKTTNTLTTKGNIRLDDAGSFTTTLQAIPPTATRTISLPDATGTVALVAGSSGQILYNNAGVNAGIPQLTWNSSTGLTFSSNWIQSTNGAASAPPMSLTGTWFTGGLASTTKPQFLIEPAGTTSNNWSTAGTGLGVNAPSGFTGNLMDLQVNGTNIMNITASGSINSQGSIFFIVTGLPAVAFPNTINRSLRVRHTADIGWCQGGNLSDPSDLTLFRDAANTLAQRNGTAAQTSRIYNTFTSDTNFERLNIRWAGNQAIIDTEAGSGGGTLRGLRIGSAATSLLGFYNATPVAQPTAVADATDAASVITQLNLALARLRTLGLIAI